MAKNEVFNEGDQVSLPVTADTPSGSPVQVGELVGVALCKEGEGGNADGFATVALKGVYNVTVTGALATYGLPVYITSAYALVITTTGNRLFGHSMGTKAGGAGTVAVRLAHNGTGSLA